MVAKVAELEQSAEALTPAALPGLEGGETAAKAAAAKLQATGEEVPREFTGDAPDSALHYLSISP